MPSVVNLHKPSEMPLRSHLKDVLRGVCYRITDFLAVGELVLEGLRISINRRVCNWRNLRRMTLVKTNNNL
jgi:hypothetical protein